MKANGTVYQFSGSSSCGFGVASDLCIFCDDSSTPPTCSAFQETANRPLTAQDLILANNIGGTLNGYINNSMVQLTIDGNPTSTTTFSELTLDNNDLCTLDKPYNLTFSYTDGVQATITFTNGWAYIVDDSNEKPEGYFVLSPTKMPS